MGRSQVLLGVKYHKLVPIECLGKMPERSGKMVTFWRCSCECGGFINAPSFRIKNGDVKSCGCLKLDEE